MFSLKKTVIAIALAFPIAASAQSMQAIKAELDALKAKVQQLEGLVDQANAKADKAATTASATPAAGGFDDDTRAEFNRVKVKSEGLEDQIEASGFKGLKISGFMDPTYIYNQRQHTSSFIFMKNFNDANTGAGGTNAGYAYDNAYFGSALIRFEKEMEGGTKWLLELMPHKSYGDGGGFNSGSIVNQAFVSIPMGSLNDKFLAGQIGSWPGYEYELGAGATSKKTITNNLLFDFTEPTFMTGVGYEHIAGPWDSKAIIGNLNNGRITDRRAPALHWRVDYAKGEFQGFGFSGLHGKTSGTTSVNYLETDAYFTRGNLNLQGQLEAGLAKGSAFNGGDAKWIGLSTLASYKITSRLEGIARFDYIKNDKNGGGTPNLVFPAGCQTADLATDPTGATPMASNCGDYRNGFGPGIDNATGLVADPNKGANRYALTLGLDYAMTPNAMLKFEVRHDRATQNTFFDVGSSTFKKDNTLFGASTVVSF
ncbi:DUF3138 family protein [Undibacterium arcticum]|uniref:DUF3138 family protein n=1 Tax=Undibacterium arcticum TaxID=1762892 RepID=A0ABV7F992_9BURK